MGYYADWSFDVTIPGNKLAAAEKAVQDVFGWEDSLADLFVHVFGEEIAAEEEPKPSPLHELADAANDTPTRGEFRIDGYVHEKWGDDEERLLNAIAPYATEDSGGTVKGEDYDTPDEWDFEGDKFVMHGTVAIRKSKLDELYAKANRLDEILAGKTSPAIADKR